MRVLFITKREDHIITSDLITKGSTSDGVDWLARQQPTTSDILHHSAWKVFSYDIENRSYIQPSRDGLLLSSFCMDGENVLTIDNTSVDNNEIFTPEILKRCLFLSHNSDHEAKWGKACNFNPMRYACTMVNGKRLLSGCEGYKFDLVSEITRQLGYKAIPIWMDKDIRSEFAACEFFRDDHILYNASDTIRLKQVYYEQRRKAEELGQLYLHNTLNSRIIPEIAEAEVRGIKHDSDKWIAIAKDREEKANKICQELNEVLLNQYHLDLELVNPLLKKQREATEKRNLKMEERRGKLEAQLLRLEQQNKTHLKSYLTQKTQLEKLGSGNVLMRSEHQLVNLPIQDQSQLINWSSSKQVLNAFKEVGMPIPEAKDQKTRQLKPSIKKEARSEWLVRYADSEHEPLMLKFDKYKKIEHNIKSFGENWVKQYVRDGRIYPSYDQAGTDTGRWTSGSKGIKKKLYPNTSQIPAREGPEYRNCFLADEDRLLLTADWKNQEGVLIISLSGDMEMKKITEVSDQHGYLGTQAWRAIYAYRADIAEKRGAQAEVIQGWRDLANNYVMDKKTPEGEKARNKFKNSMGLFPILYGAQPHKVAVTSQITTDEAQIGMNVIKAHAPLADKFLQANREYGAKHGYVIHNTRSGSRRWFQPVLDQIHYGYPMSKSKKVEVELAAGNSCIQGGGSDILKEAIAMVALWSNLFKQDIKFVMSNYDEGVWSIPKNKEQQYKRVIEQFMIRAAKNYLIEGVDMEVDIKVNSFWEK